MAEMLWITLIFAAIAGWAVLSLVAVDHSDRVSRLHARMRAAAEQAAEQTSPKDNTPVAGAPPGSADH